jgi:hypothetical protein
MKMVVPLFIAIIFVSSIFVVFGSGSKGNAKATLIIDFGQPDMYYTSKQDIGDNTTALNLLAGYAPQIKIESGVVKCIMDYCNTATGNWSFYKVYETELGPQVIKPDIEPEYYYLTPDETILFRYEFNITQGTTNETANATLVFTNLDSGTKTNVTGITLPLDKEGACKVYEAAGFGKCDNTVTINETEAGTYVIAGLCQAEWKWCTVGMPVSWATISSNLTIRSIAIA